MSWLDRILDYLGIPRHRRPYDIDPDDYGLPKGLA